MYIQMCSSEMDWFEIDRMQFSLFARTFRVSSRRCINHVRAENDQNILHVDHETVKTRYLVPYFGNYLQNLRESTLLFNHSGL